VGVWLRELAGWLLLGIGLAIFAIVYFVFLLNKLVLQAIIFGIVGVFVFRAGVALLKVALAARAMADVKRDYATSAAVVRRTAKPVLGNANPNPGKPRASVLPGPQGA